MVISYMLLGMILGFFLGIIPEGFGRAILLGGILGVLIGIYHKLHEIYKELFSQKNSIANSEDRE